MNFKGNISYNKDIFDAGIKRIKDSDNVDFTLMNINEIVSRYIATTKDYFMYSPGELEVYSSFNKNESIKDFKYFININNSKLLSLEEQNLFFKNYAYSLVKRIEKEVLSLDAETEEKEIRFFNGSSFVHYNNFSRESDGGLGERNKDFLIDHKTKFRFEEREKSSILKNLGITLPVENEVSVPIVKVSIINELTTSGDTLEPLVSTNPMNVLFKNRNFSYSVIFKEFDNKRKFAREHASLGLLVELGCVTPVNNIKIASSSICSFDIESISYIDTEGKEIKINEFEIENSFESNYLFKAVTTKYFIIKFSQKTPVGTSEIEEEREDIVSKVMRLKNMKSGSSKNISKIEGYVYDISIDSIKVNLFSFGDKGVFRSEYKEISNAVSFNIQESSAIPSLVEIKGSYINDYLILSDNVLCEKYAGVKFFDKQGTVIENDVIPLVDNEYKQVEYLEPVGNVFRLKLFPLMHGLKSAKEIGRIDSIQRCFPIEEQVTETEDVVEEEIETEDSINIIDDPPTTEIIDAINKGLADKYESWQDRAKIEDLLIQEALRDLLSENLAQGIELGVHYGTVDVKDFILDDGMAYDINETFMYELKEIATNVYDFRLISPSNPVNPNTVVELDRNLIGSMNYANAYRNNYTASSYYSSNLMGNVNLFSLQPQGSAYQMNLFNLSEEDQSNNIESANETSTQSEGELVCFHFYQVQFRERHNLKMGNYFDFYIHEEQFYLRGLVSKVIDEYTVLVPKHTVGTVPASLLSRELTGGEISAVETNVDNIEIFEETKKLVLGEDYSISPDNGSTWYEYIPSGKNIGLLTNKVTAGDFLVKIKNPDHGKFYLGKYFVLPFQKLNKSGKILLKNKRVEIQDPLSSKEGVISSILVIRNGLKNKYLSPVIYEYTLNVFEENPRKIKKGLKWNKILTDKNRRNSTNVN